MKKGIIKRLRFAFSGTAVVESTDHTISQKSLLDAINHALINNDSPDALVRCLRSDGSTSQIKMDAAGDGFEIAFDFYSEDQHIKYPLIVRFSSSGIESFVCPTGNDKDRIALSRIYCENGTLNTDLFDRQMKGQAVQPAYSRHIRNGANVH